MTRIARLIAVAGAVVLPLWGCLSIEQAACTAQETLCLDGSVWACRSDGSGWDLEAICPGSTCEDGRCLLEALPSFDATPIIDAGLAPDLLSPSDEVSPTESGDGD